jgi:hypothetical protein
LKWLRIWSSFDEEYELSDAKTIWGFSYKLNNNTNNNSNSLLHHYSALGVGQSVSQLST